MNISKKQLGFLYGHMPPRCKHHPDGDQTDIGPNYCQWSDAGGAWLVTIPGPPRLCPAVIVGL